MAQRTRKEVLVIYTDSKPQVTRASGYKTLTQKIFSNVNSLAVYMGVVARWMFRYMGGKEMGFVGE